MESSDATVTGVVSHKGLTEVNIEIPNDEPSSSEIITSSHLCFNCGTFICDCENDIQPPEDEGYLSRFITMKRNQQCKCKMAAMQASVNNLLVKYTTCIAANKEQDSGSVSICGGGVQQLLNSDTKTLPTGEILQQNSSNRNLCKKCQKLLLVDQELNITELPRDVMLHVMKFLGAQDICRMSSVCKLWLEYSNDEWLWQQKLKTDVYTWKSISHLTNPDMYRECASDWPSKEIYLRCCPEVNKLRHQEVVGFLNLSSFIRSFLPKTPPRIAMFGPGLESETSAIVRRIMCDQENNFHATGLVPGIGGVGSGVAFKLRKKYDLVLSTLYSMTKEQRRNLTTQERMRQNKMLVQQDVEMADPDVDHPIELSSSIQELCRIVGGFVFVINIKSGSSDDLDVARRELFAMVNERWSAPRIPLLIVACVRHNHIKPTPLINIVKRLKLGKLSRPWLVKGCSLDKMDDVCDAFEWLIEQSHRP